MAFVYPPEQILRIQMVLLESLDEDVAVDLFRSVNQNFDNLKLSGATFPRSLGHALTTAAQGGWLLALLHKAAERAPADEPLQQLVTQLSIHTGRADVDHFALCRLDGNFPFIDRQPLRDSIRELDRAAGQRIVVVTGGTKSGKSYSLQFLYHLRSHLQSFALARIDLNRESRLAGPNQALHPHHVATALAKQLGIAQLVEAPPEDHQWARWVYEFGDLLEIQLAQSQQRHWIVVDSFNQVVLTQPVADLIKELALRVGGPLTQFRLILLGYSDELPPEISPTVRPVHLGAIDEEHLIDFFINYLRESEIAGTEDELADRVDAAVDAVLAGLAPNEDQYLSRLFSAVGAHLPTLVGPRP